MIAYDNYIKATAMDYKHANQIHTNAKKNSLWLGDLASAENVKWLRENNIRTGIHE